MGLDLGKLELRVVGVHLLDLLAGRRSQDLRETIKKLITKISLAFATQFAWLCEKFS